RLLEAYARAKPAFPASWPLVVVGPAGWGPDVAPAADVVLAGAVEAGILSALYTRARLLAYVPLEEGFGLPVVEAMSLGTPVVSSAVPSADGAARAVDPKDVDSIADGLLAVATDDALRASLVARGLDHSGRLTWAACAHSLAELWGSLL
ncbi:MAG TPA: glycosyltransferase, partial [Acidimicrobiales bacterium]|nr:glycosyltransferase [Acidimicrobiales bacterium]